MGAIITESNGEFSGKTEQPAGGTGGTVGRGKSTSTTSTSTETGGTGGTGRTGGTGTNPGTGTTAETEKQGQEISGLAILNDDEKKRYELADETEKKKILKNARRRAQYAEKKAANGGQAKPRKVNKSKKSEPPIDTSALNVMLTSLSAVVASRPNCEHWLLTDTEVKSITEPLGKMIQENESLANLGQYSNQIALVMACVTVVAPRLIITVQKHKEVKQRERTGQTTDTVVKQSSGNPGKAQSGNQKINGGSDRRTSGNGASISTSEPWYGEPVY